MKLIKLLTDRNDKILLNSGILPENGLEYLNEKLLLFCIQILLVFGLIAYIPSVILAIKEKLFTLFITDTIILLLLLAMVISRYIGFKKRIYIILCLNYVLGIILLIVPEYKGLGLIYLLTFSVIASIFLNSREAFVAFCLNLVTIAFLNLLVYFNPEYISLTNADSLGRLIIISINFVVLTAIVSLIIGYFVQEVKDSFLREEELKKKLKKKSERLIEAKVKAEESDHLKSAFLANVSHEFRTPMNSIIGFTEIMLYTNTDEIKRKRYLENIHKSSEQLLQIINNTIEYSKIELGTISLDPVKFDVYGILETINEQLKPKCPKNVGFFVSHYLNNESIKIVSDRYKFTQIFTNLILNAFKFTTAGSVSFGLMESAHNNFYQFFVKDTGIGIRKEKQKDIFTRFHKEDDFKEGTGLGLSISATLIYHMGGRIWIESESGVGTTFYFILPKELSAAKISENDL
jgi:signal transduction histidine kinase